MRHKDEARSADPAREAVLRRLLMLARLLDDRFAVPGTNWRFGFDGLIGLVPGIGDALTTALAAYILFEARRLGVPTSTLGRMLGNIGIDFLVGAVPLAGDFFDFAWKANRRNVDLLLRHLDREGRGSGRRRRGSAG